MQPCRWPRRVPASTTQQRACLLACPCICRPHAAPQQVGTQISSYLEECKQKRTARQRSAQAGATHSRGQQLPLALERRAPVVPPSNMCGASARAQCPLAPPPSSVFARGRRQDGHQVPSGGCGAGGAGFSRAGGQPPAQLPHQPPPISRGQRSMPAQQPRAFCRHQQRPGSATTTVSLPPSPATAQVSSPFWRGFPALQLRPWVWEGRLPARARHAADQGGRRAMGANRARAAQRAGAAWGRQDHHSPSPPSSSPPWSPARSHRPRTLPHDPQQRRRTATPARTHPPVPASQLWPSCRRRFPASTAGSARLRASHSRSCHGRPGHPCGL